MSDGGAVTDVSGGAGAAQPALDADGFLVEEPAVRTLPRTESKLKQDATWTKRVAPRLGPELADEVEQYNTDEAKTVGMGSVEAADELAARHQAVDDVEKDVPVIAFATQQINRALSKKFGAKMNVAYTLPSEARGIKPPSRDAAHPRPGDGAAEAQREGMLARRRKLKVSAWSRTAAAVGCDRAGCARCVGRVPCGRSGQLRSMQGSGGAGS